MAVTVRVRDGQEVLCRTSGEAARRPVWAPFVREGGLVAFHDIVPDFRTRFGVATDSDAGQVPVFWNWLKTEGHGGREFVENSEQDGFGIGVIEWSAEWRAVAARAAADR